MKCIFRQNRDDVSAKGFFRQLLRKKDGKPRNVLGTPYYFHSPIEFNAAISVVQLPLVCLDMPSPYYNADMWMQAQEQLSAQLKAIDSRTRQPYTMHVAGLFNSSEPPLPDLSTVAGTLCMSDRTLNRRLLEEGVNFRRLKSEALISRAKQYLAHTEKSVEAIAADLGYQDAANFRLAFRKLTKHSPGEYRSNFTTALPSSEVPLISPANKASEFF